MLKLKPYYYYSKSDSSKEPLDKILAPDSYEASYYFASRKNMFIEEFLKIYCVTINEDTKPK